MATPEMEQAQIELSKGMVMVTELLEPVFEFGQGIRARMEADGWSPTAAEAIALQAVQTMLASCLANFGKGS